MIKLIKLDTSGLTPPNSRMETHDDDVGEVRTMKIALGMIIRSLETDIEIINFIENAEKYGHKLDCVIVAYTHNLNPNAVQKINRKSRS